MIEEGENNLYSQLKIRAVKVENVFYTPKNRHKTHGGRREIYNKFYEYEKGLMDYQDNCTDNSQMFTEYASGGRSDNALRERIFMANMRIAFNAVKRHKKRSNYLDILNTAMFCLWRSINKFDVKRFNGKTSFYNYARKAIENGIKRETIITAFYIPYNIKRYINVFAHVYRKRGCVSAEEIYEITGKRMDKHSVDGINMVFADYISLNAPVKVADGDDSTAEDFISGLMYHNENDFELTERNKELREIVNSLDTKRKLRKLSQRDVILMLFGLEGNTMTGVAIAEQLGVRPQAVNNLKKRTLERLKVKVKEKGLDIYL